MNQEKDIRWKQRFQNFEKAMNSLSDAVAQREFSELERAGLIQFFEFSFEFAWKTLKDYLESKAVEATFPREVIKQGFAYEIITDGDVWMEMLAKRNLMAHTYDEGKALLAQGLIVDTFFPVLEQLYVKLKGEL